MARYKVTCQFKGEFIQKTLTKELEAESEEKAREKVRELFDLAQKAARAATVARFGQEAAVECKTPELEITEVKKVE